MIVDYIAITMNLARTKLVLMAPKRYTQLCMHIPVCTYIHACTCTFILAKLDLVQYHTMED